MIHGYGNFKCWQKLLLRSNHSWSNITIDNCMQVNIYYFMWLLLVLAIYMSNMGTKHIIALQVNYEPTMIWYIGT